MRSKAAKSNSVKNDFQNRRRFSHLKFDGLNFPSTKVCTTNFSTNLCPFLFRLYFFSCLPRYTCSLPKDQENFAKSYIVRVKLRDPNS